jgi:hypothetical protein
MRRLSDKLLHATVEEFWAFKVSIRSQVLRSTWTTTWPRNILRATERSSNHFGAAQEGTQEF